VPFLNQVATPTKATVSGIGDGKNEVKLVQC